MNCLIIISFIIAMSLIVILVCEVYNVDSELSYISLLHQLGYHRRSKIKVYAVKRSCDWQNYLIFCLCHYGPLIILILMKQVNRAFWKIFEHFTEFVTHFHLLSFLKYRVSLLSDVHESFWLAINWIQSEKCAGQMI